MSSDSSPSPSSYASSPSLTPPPFALGEREMEILRDVSADLSEQSAQMLIARVAGAKELMMRAPGDQLPRQKRRASTMPTTQTPTPLFEGDDYSTHSSFWSHAFVGNGNLAIVLKEFKNIRGSLKFKPEIEKPGRMPPNFAKLMAIKHLAEMNKDGLSQDPSVDELAKSYSMFHYRVFESVARGVRSMRKCYRQKRSRDEGAATAAAEAATAATEAAAAAAAEAIEELKLELSNKLDQQTTALQNAVAKHIDDQNKKFDQLLAILLQEMNDVGNP